MHYYADKFFTFQRLICGEMIVKVYIFSNLSNAWGAFNHYVEVVSRSSTAVFDTLLPLVGILILNYLTSTF